MPNVNKSNLLKPKGIQKIKKIDYFKVGKANKVAKSKNKKYIYGSTKKMSSNLASIKEIPEAERQSSL